MEQSPKAKIGSQPVQQEREEFVLSKTIKRVQMASNMFMSSNQEINKNKCQKFSSNLFKGKNVMEKFVNLKSKESLYFEGVKGQFSKFV